MYVRVCVCPHVCVFVCVCVDKRACGFVALSLLPLPCNFDNAQAEQLHDIDGA